MASPDSTDANDLMVWLTKLVSGYAEAKGLGTVYVNRVAYRIGA